MLEAIITKLCSHCKETKSTFNFSKSRSGKDGYKSCCKICKNKIQRLYRQTDAGKVTQKQYQQSDKFKITQKLYRQTDAGKVTQKQYQQSDKGKATQGRYAQSEKGKVIAKQYQQSDAGKVARRKANINYRINYPERINAIQAVNNAIKSGQLPPINTQKCKCKEQAVEYHHWSYLPEHWLDVKPLCRECHTNKRRKIA